MSVLLVVAHEDPATLGRLAEVARGLGHGAVQAADLERLRSALRTHHPAAVVLSHALFAALGNAPAQPVRAWVVLDPPDAAHRGLAGSDDRVAPGPHTAPGCRASLADRAEPAALTQALAQALAGAAIEAERERLAAALANAAPAPLVGRGSNVRRLSDQLDRIAGTPSTTALIAGEPGSGRLQAARELHARSSRRHGPFVHVDAAQLASDGLAERLGAGAAGEARDGTFVVHRVEALELGDQAVLLALVVERTWTARPSELELPLAARLVATAPPDLEERVAAGLFRDDLFSRLNVMSARIAPLRERGRDIAAVAEHHLTSIAAARGLPPPTLDAGAREVLSKHSWPGNELELREVLTRALASARAAGRGSSIAVGPEHLASVIGLQRDGSATGSEPDATARPAASDGDVLPLGDRSWRSVEEALIRRVLAETVGNRSRTARILGVNRTTLYNKLRAYGIEDA